MGLLKPESGILFWMTISFVIVFFILAKYAFPVIIKAINSRKEYIDSSLDAAKQAEKSLVNLKSEGDVIVNNAQKERVTILKEASDAKEKIINDARERARVESDKIISEAKGQAAVERDEILKDARRQVALLSVKIAEKILRGDLENPDAQNGLAERLIDEMNMDNKKE